MYLLSSMLIAVGVGAQLVLYNLYLIELGYREDVIGQVAGAAALGVALGGLPAGLFYDRFGGKAAFMVAGVGMALSMALRALSTDLAWLITWAVLYGLSNSLLFVSIFPFITEQSSVEERSYVYGMNLAVWTGFMVVGSFLSGYGPGAARAVWPVLSELSAQRVYLLLAAVIGMAGLIPIALIRLAPERSPRRRRAILPGVESRQVIVRGAVVLTLFGLVIGLTQPFYNTYFKIVHEIDTELIGTFISLSQLMGLVSALLVPYAVRRWGLVAGPTLLSLASVPLTFSLGLRLPLAAVVIVLLLKVGIDWLATTPLMNLLMEVVSPADRGAMSGVRLITNYGAQAVAGAWGGWLVVGAGYTWLFTAAAGCQLLAACTIWILFRAQRQTSHMERPVPEVASSIKTS
jgi:MFS family permease